MTPETLQPHNPAPGAVLVTGAARRLGRCIALALAQAGWRVAVHARQADADAQSAAAACARNGVPAPVLEADLADETAVRALLPRVVAAMGGAVDAVVNSAAMFEFDCATNFSPALLARHLQTNTAAPLLLAQALAAHLAERGAPPASGCVVHLLDQQLFNPNPDFLSYTLSKAALHAAVPMQALALAPTVRVVGVAPGLTLPGHQMSAARFAELHTQSPLGRASSPQDVAAAVRFALENRSITGSTLLVDGGQRLMHFARDFSMM
ncbi:MAG: SDR family oxidoreductase [Burkholderiaceae bacterium]|nr:SDR family oxidoreductase [Burkholderiaceae bacterium]